MCGRFVRRTPVSAIAEMFGVARVATGLAPSYNVAPGHYLVVINDDGGRQLV
jgi:putative SOS response-associated peptidase YedK